MDWAKEYVKTAPDGAVFITDVLTHARGRQGRVWQTDPGQLINTILLKSPLFKKSLQPTVALRLNQLNMALTLGVLEALQPYGVVLKWPNDFIGNNKKIGGILLEALWSQSGLNAVIVGLALNSNNSFNPSNDLYPIATSLRDMKGANIDMSILQESLFKSLDTWYARWNTLQFDEIFQGWKAAQAYQEKSIMVHSFDGSCVAGNFQEVKENGDLVIQLDNGRHETISFYVVESIQQR